MRETHQFQRSTLAFLPARSAKQSAFMGSNQEAASRTSAVVENGTNTDENLQLPASFCSKLASRIIREVQLSTGGGRSNGVRPPDRSGRIHEPKSAGAL